MQHSHSGIDMDGAYPSRQEVEGAIRLQVCAWKRFLRQPKDNDENVIYQLIKSRFIAFGGSTAAIDQILRSF